MSDIEAKEKLEMLENAYRVSKKGSAVYEALIEFVTLEDLAEAIQAIEKQIPKKPQKYFGKFSGVWCSCGKYLGKGYFVDKPSFCPDCGQKLDWSDEE